MAAIGFVCAAYTMLLQSTSGLKIAQDLLYQEMHSLWRLLFIIPFELIDDNVDDDTSNLHHPHHHSNPARLTNMNKLEI